jgi:hypothetical protein
MNIEIKLYDYDMVPAVRNFNSRLKMANVSHKFPETHISKVLPKQTGRKIYQEYFLAVHNSSVRGGYLLKHQEFSIGGKIVSIADYQLPLSEGIIDKKYFFVGLQLLSHALKRQPLLICLGIGGLERSIAQILTHMRWNIFLVPFYFKIYNAYRFLRNISYIRKTPLTKITLDTMATLGVGGLIRLFQLRAVNTGLLGHTYHAEEIADFSVWADDLWAVCREKYSMVAVRDSITLNILYPVEDSRCIRLKICKGTAVVGWAVLLDTRMSAHKHFGNMRVGSIVDCLALPEHADGVIRVATKFLEMRKVDMIVSNQSHHSWCEALRKAGFFRGPSNYVFAASRQLSLLLKPFDLNKTGFHINRGDGDGPLHL